MVRFQRFSPLRRLAARLGGAVALAAALATAPAAEAADPVQIRIAGGLAGVTQYTKLEEPFWRERIRELSGGRIEATIQPFDRSGLRGQEMLKLMRLGVVPFGTALLGLVSGDDPELGAVDLPALNPDMASLRRTVGLYRGHLTEILRERYEVELLGIYAYPAQVVYCAKPFSALADLAGRRVRTSAVAQSEMMRALGAVPVITPFSEIVSAMSTGVVECAITGTLSGNEVGLSKVTSHIHAMAINWGVSIFGANLSAWAALPPDLRDVLRRGVADLEADIWEAADRETERGLACNVGSPACVGGVRGAMALVPVSARDEAARRTLLLETVLPGWIERCGPGCATAWNRLLAPTLGLSADTN